MTLEATKSVEASRGKGTAAMVGGRKILKKFSIKTQKSDGVVPYKA